MAVDSFDTAVNQVISLLSPVVDDFFVCLQNEAKIISTGSVQELEQVAANKQQLAMQLEQSTVQANQLLAKSDCHLQHLLDSSTDCQQKLPKNTQSQLIDLSKKLSKCFDHNQANGIAVQTLSKINRFTLDLLTGKDKPVKLYGAKGTESVKKPSGIKLGEA